MENYVLPDIEDSIIHIAQRENDFSWKKVLADLISEHNIDPWNIKITRLSHLYLEYLKTLPKIDFHLSGKLLFIASFLLKMKSETLIQYQHQEEEDDLYEHDEDNEQDMIESPTKRRHHNYVLKVRNPFARKKRVSFTELVQALEEAFATSQQRKILRKERVEYDGPHLDPQKSTQEIIEETYTKIQNIKAPSITFHEITLECSWADKIAFFFAVLYLNFDQKVELSQKEHFGTIVITLIQP